MVLANIIFLSHNNYILHFEVVLQLRIGESAYTYVIDIDKVMGIAVSHITSWIISC